jgi:hypothetical protein
MAPHWHLFFSLSHYFFFLTPTSSCIAWPCMQLHDEQLACHSCPSSQSFNAVVRMAAQSSWASRSADQPLHICRFGCLCHSMDGRAHRRQPSVGDRTPYQIELGEDLPPGSRGLFELSTSPAYPLPVKAPVNLLATTIHTTPLRRHVRLQRLIYSHW